MPVLVTNTAAGGNNYANPFIGPVDHVAQIRLDISSLTTGEVDSDGYLKPGVPLNSAGRRVGADAAAGSASSTAYAGNTGNGTMGTVTVSAGAKEGTYNLEIIEPAANAGKFSVEDPDGVIIGTGTVGVAFSAGGLAFTLADGATDFVAGDGFTIATTLTAGGTASKNAYGVVFEPIKLPITVPLTNTTLGNETGDCDIAVNTAGLINRDIAEDNLGRSYTAAELAAFTAAGSNFTLTNT